MPNSLTYNKVIRYNNTLWVQQAEPNEIRKSKTLLHKKIYDRREKYAKEETALQKLRGTRKFKIDRRSNKTILKHLWAKVPQDDGTYKIMRVAA